MDDEERENVLWPTVPPREAHWVIRVFSSSRYFAAFAVLGTFLAAITLYVYGTLVVIQLIWSTIIEYHISVEGVKHLQVVFIEMTDVFLLGTVLFIVAFAVEGLGESSLIEVGASVAIVIAALSLLLVVTHRRPGGHGSSQE